MTTKHESENKLRLLLVEDNDVDAYTIQKIVEMKMPCACEVSHAEDMRHAEIFLSEHNNIDVILLDLGLPDTTGGEDTFKRIYDKNSHIPIIILISKDDHALASTLVDNGAENYIIKSRIIVDYEPICHAISLAVFNNKNEFKYQKEDTVIEKVG